ncbi:MAG: ATP synthase F0 subunit B [Candidatus Vogelbacteria bacterium CG10_big_fil_rev_8_21_14_0_10_45_14]|uniref:ATP synthase subunit b n=1 Tax=Candidatus Vogelbacteria bacterium CG10_big_fil_rev_8_21_14_0_10_45_14 TaxID=1975042 RepID=A0A2H0RJW1_9BACT|nr:MAG: ATP synthase F0 subunit B [Candidatus Vogelbacteria bacterium CG10_big_fil_rev_8_21_14_0_10_45_14]
MERLIEVLGLNINSLIAQFVNFAVLLFLLWKFGYGPILRFMEKRKKMIEDGVSRAREAEEEWRKIEKEREQILEQARVEGQAIVERAREDAIVSSEAVKSAARDKVLRFAEETKRNLREERARAREDVRRDASELVLAAVASIVGGDVKIHEGEVRKALASSSHE